MILRVFLFVLNVAAFLVVSVVFLPVLVVANYGVEFYEKWWEKISSF